MPVLLSDASSCSTDLGRILYTSPSEWNVHMNIVSTNTMSNLFTSHIEYQISICAIPCNSLAMDIRFFYMWTRFRSVKRLWEQLADLHKSSQIVGERTSSITTFLNYVLGHSVFRQSKKAQEISKPLNHKNPLEPLRESHSNGESSSSASFGTNIVHVSKYKGEDPRLLFISEHEDLPTPSVPTAELYVHTYPIPAIAMHENSTVNVQENSAGSTAPLMMNATSAVMNQTSTSQSSCVLPSYYYVALSQQPQFTQVSRISNGPLQQANQNSNDFLQNPTTSAGVEPAIFGSVDRRVIHCATRPHDEIPLFQMTLRWTLTLHSELRHDVRAADYMSRCRRTHRMVIKKKYSTFFGEEAMIFMVFFKLISNSAHSRDDFDVVHRSGSVMKTDSDEGCYSGEGGLANGNNDADEEAAFLDCSVQIIKQPQMNHLNFQVYHLFWFLTNGKYDYSDGKRISSAAVDNSSESDEMPSVFENIFSEHIESPFNETGANDLDGPKAKKARDDLGNAREDWPTKESGSSMTIPMPMCIRLVELYRRCRAFLRTFSQKKEDRKARHQMWDAIDARLYEEFGIHSGAGARGKIEALRRETSNGIIPQDTNIRFTPAEMEMVRMLYQNGDKVLNTVNENNEPFYMQLEALMRREKRSPSSSNAKSMIYPQIFSQVAQNGSKKHVPHVTKEPPALFNSIVSLFSKPFDVLSAAAHFPKTDPVPNNNGGHELAIMTELIARQMNVLKRQEELQRRAELLFEQQLARESKIVDSITSLTKAASHLEQIGEFLLNTCRYNNVNDDTFSPNNS
ncbi:PX domain-containing protein [Dirofilaria immitis]|nr:PX domain-containing protein [Dirofilaria immitis]